MPPSFREILTDRLGRDLQLPRLGQELLPTASGDWPSVEGSANLQAAIERRPTIQRGEIRHRPEVGGNLPSAVGDPQHPTNQAATAVFARNDLLQDRRIGDVDVRVSTDPAQPTQTLYDFAVRPAGADDLDVVQARVRGT
jgi:hypothetical protein